MILAILQARLTSTRLPNKTLTKIGDETLLDIVYRRVSKSSLINKVIVACPDTIKNDYLHAYCLSRDIPIFRGSEADVLARYYNCAQMLGAETIVRVTCDDPLKCPIMLDEVVEFYLTSGADYVANWLDGELVEGLDIEVFSMSTLTCAHKNATLAGDREHVTPYIRSSQNLFTVYDFHQDPRNREWRFTLDTEADLSFFRRICAELGPLSDLKLRQVQEFLVSQPEVASINWQPRKLA